MLEVIVLIQILNKDQIILIIGVVLAIKTRILWDLWKLPSWVWLAQVPIYFENHENISSYFVLTSFLFYSFFTYYFVTVFFGAFVAIVSIYSIKARRQAKSNGGYPAPLAIPLPSYSVDPNNNSHPGSMTTTAILHHGDIARQSIKSNAKFRPSA